LVGRCSFKKFSTLKSEITFNEGNVADPVIFQIFLVDVSIPYTAYGVLIILSFH